MYIKRSIEQTITKLSEEFPVIVITGARQVGKSTMLRMIKDEGMNYVSLDDMDVRNLALSDPKYFLEQYSYPLLIDEIQYAPDLLPYIKMIVDEERLKSLKNNEPTRALFWAHRFATIQRYEEHKRIACRQSRRFKPIFLVVKRNYV